MLNGTPHRDDASPARDDPCKGLSAKTLADTGPHSGLREALQWRASFHMDRALVWLRKIIDVTSEVVRTPAPRMRIG